MAEVWRADAVFETGDSHPVAIKRVLQKLSNEPLYRSMFEDEARLGMLLRHPNIVRVYDARDVAGTLIMIMELVDGVSLKAMLEHAHRRRACMPVPTALYLLRELCKALDYTHCAVDGGGNHLGIIHRDVSPHNILLGRDGVVKLADFGLADATVHHTARSSDVVGGKLGYLAPEIIRQQPASHRVDIFAAGIVVWEALSGKRLFHGRDDHETVRNVAACQVDPASRHNPNVPREVDALLYRMLASNPNDRYPSAGAVLDDVTALIASIDSGVGSRDVSLVVGLHMAAVKEQAPAAPIDHADLLAGELDAFVQAAANSEYDIGAQPLDPDEFGGSLG